MNITYRLAKPEDCALILQFIKDLAEYEKMTNDVVATEELLAQWIFEKKAAEVIFAMADGKEVAFAVFCQNFSTFVGRAGLYLEDIYVMPQYRGRGIGKAMLGKLADIAKQRGYGRMEWVCLDWNTPSIDFYHGLGAEGLTEWTTYRLAGDALADLAEGNDVNV
ncbi:MAG: GNAT family N-acetyltransferase [Defluviitaleaceae bacterium]|nr:GNAT family N-acetyltransferase [Defluviitaleaceae bacterium]